jgi:hypothetical protein
LMELQEQKILTTAASNIEIKIWGNATTRIQLHHCAWCGLGVIWF